MLSLSFLIKFERSEDFEENEDEKKNPTVLHRGQVPAKEADPAENAVAVAVN